MKVLIIIDETNFYHPMFLYNLIQKLNLKKFNIKVGLITKIKSTNSLERYLFKNFFKLHFDEIFKLLIKKLFFTFLSFLNLSNYNFFSVLSLLEKKKIDYFKVEYDINKREYLNIINDYKPDLIISSCSVIFGSELLNIPKYGCINRHSSLLPSYGGLFPVLHTIADGLNIFGVSIIIMDDVIDNGKVIAQKSFTNDSKNLSKIYRKCFDISSHLIIEAIDNILNNKTFNSQYKKSYFTFPSTEIWEKFRKNGGKFI